MAGLAAGAAAAGRLGAAGAAAGRLGAAGAAAGRLGAATGAAKQYPQAFASIEKMTTLMQNLAPIMNAASGVVGQLGDAVKKTIPGFTTLEKGVKAAGETVVAVAMAVPNMTKALIAFGKEIAEIVRLANPASVQKFNAAVDDVHSLLGQALAPVLDLVTKAIRNAADSFGFIGRIGAAAARALDPFQRALETVNEWFGRAGLHLSKLASSFGTSFAIVGEYVDAFVKALEPLGDLLIDILGSALVSIIGTHGPLEIATATLVGFTRAVGDLTKWLADSVRAILALVGVDLSNESGTKPGSSVNAAVRNASVGSLESVMQKALTSAYSLGTGANPAVETAIATKSLDATATKIHTAITTLATNVEKLPENLANAIANLPSKTAAAVATSARKARDAVSDAVDGADTWAGETFGFKPATEAKSLKKRLFG